MNNRKDVSIFGEVAYLLRVIISSFIVIISVGQSLRAESLPHGVRLSSVSTNGAVHISGTVILPPPCKVNNDQLWNAEFGNVRTDLIDGVNYASQSIPVSVSCTGTPSSQLQLELRGDVDTDDSILLTSVPGLGLKIFRDGAKFSLNAKVNVSSSDNFFLTAVPIKLASSSPSTGEFNAAATLIVTQQ